MGKIITSDVCKQCNEHFGKVCDHALAYDQKIIEAAKIAGFKETDFWSRFEGVQPLPSGREIRVAYSNGSFRPRPELSDLNRLAIPVTDGTISAQHLRDFGARLVEKVRNKSTGLSDLEIRRRVDDLLLKMQTDPTGTHRDPVLGEGVKSTPLGSQVIYKQETKPWETHWCIAKIFFELSLSLWPSDYCNYFGEILGQWQYFLKKREFSAENKQGLGIFEFEDLPSDKASRSHTIEGTISATEVSWDLTFFGIAKWKTYCRVRPVRPPPGPAYRFKLTNPVGNDSPDASYDIMEV